MPAHICPRCGQKQNRLDPIAGCIFCGRGNTLLYAPLITDITQPSLALPAVNDILAKAIPAVAIGRQAPMRFAAVLNAVRQMHDQANLIRKRGAYDDANLIDATLVQLLFPIVNHLDGTAGWLRAVRVVLDVATATQLDALIAPAWSRAAVRLVALFVVPEVERIGSVDKARRLIDTAIHLGAPAFNDGDARLCATIYWAAALTLTVAPVGQGAMRLTRVLAPLRQAITAPQAIIGGDERAIKDYAWKLRHALDAALRM